MRDSNGRSWTTREAAAAPATFAFSTSPASRLNDTFGHAAGDMLLDRLAGRSRGSRLARARLPLGGDEFCVLLDGRVPATAR